MIDFSRMAWQPMITRQPKGYNDPTAYHESYTPKYETPVFHQARRCAITDTETGDRLAFDTLAEAGKHINCTGRNVSRSIQKGYLVQGRFKAEYL
jgi:hypothetical protein